MLRKCWLPNILILYSILFSVPTGTKIVTDVHRNLKIELNLSAYQDFALSFLNVHESEGLETEERESLLTLHTLFQDICRVDETLKILNEFSAESWKIECESPSNFWQFISQSLQNPPFYLKTLSKNIILRCCSMISNQCERAVSLLPLAPDLSRIRRQAASLSLSQYLTDWSNFCWNRTYVRYLSDVKCAFCMIQIEFQTECLVTFRAFFYGIGDTETQHVWFELLKGLEATKHIHRSGKIFCPFFICTKAIDQLLKLYLRSDTLELVSVPKNHFALSSLQYRWFQNTAEVCYPAISDAFAILYISRLLEHFNHISESPGSITFYKEILVEAQVFSVQYLLVLDPLDNTLVTEIFYEPVSISDGANNFKTIESYCKFLSFQDKVAIARILAFQNLFDGKKENPPIDHFGMSSLLQTSNFVIVDLDDVLPNSSPDSYDLNYARIITESPVAIYIPKVVSKSSVRSDFMASFLANKGNSLSISTSEISVVADLIKLQNSDVSKIVEVNEIMFLIPKDIGFYAVTTAMVDEGHVLLIFEMNRPHSSPIFLPLMGLNDIPKLDAKISFHEARILDDIKIISGNVISLMAPRLPFNVSQNLAQLLVDLQLSYRLASFKSLYFELLTGIPVHGKELMKYQDLCKVSRFEIPLDPYFSINQSIAGSRRFYNFLTTMLLFNFKSAQDNIYFRFPETFEYSIPNCVLLANTPIFLKVSFRHCDQIIDVNNDGSFDIMVSASEEPLKGTIEYNRSILVLTGFEVQESMCLKVLHADLTILVNHEVIRSLLVSGVEVTDNLLRYGHRLLSNTHRTSSLLEIEQTVSFERHLGFLISISCFSIETFIKFFSADVVKNHCMNRPILICDDQFHILNREIGTDPYWITFVIIDSCFQIDILSDACERKLLLKSFCDLIRLSSDSANQKHALYDFKETRMAR